VSQQFPLTPHEGGRVLRHSAVGQDAPSAVQSSSGLFSLTYEPYYGLMEKPFSLSADPRFLFRSPEHAPAFEELLNGIRRREGLITLTGEIGTGKTTLIRSVLQHLDRRTFSAFVPDPFVSREDLLKMLLVDFGVVSIADLKRGSLNGASRPDLSYPLYEFLDSLVPLQAFAVLIIDEAQNLPLPLLEEVRILSDLEGRERLLQVVLVGQPELRSHLKLPEMRQVDQRVSVRCELTPLARDGVAGYVDYRLRVAGDGHGRVEFSDAAIDAVYHGSGGTPRLINLICDRALHRGYSARVGRIEPGFVWDAIADLGLEISPVKGPAPVERQEMAAKTAPAPLVLHETISPPLFVHAKSAVSVPASERVILADFAPERKADDSSASVDEGIARGWKLVAAVALVAVFAIGALLAYMRVQALSELPTITLPPPPPRSVPTIQPAPPPDSAWLTSTATRPVARTSIERNGAGRFAIQVASFETLPRAEQFVAELTSAGYRARAVELDLGPERGRLVQVLVGGYRSAQDAGIDLARLRSRRDLADAHLAPLPTSDQK
jgi:type II secretory pathway predicted ATPase ExeA/cell division septation protein DedD